MSVWNLRESKYNSCSLKGWNGIEPNDINDRKKEKKTKRGELSPWK